MEKVFCMRKVKSMEKVFCMRKVKSMEKVFCNEGIYFFKNHQYKLVFTINENSSINLNHVLSIRSNSDPTNRNRKLF